MELTSVKRQQSDQQMFKDILSRLRTGDASDADADFLLKLHLSNFSSDDADTITTGGVTMHLFATKAPRNEYNFKRLADVSSSTNPVAVLKTQWISSKKKQMSTIISHFKS